MLDKNGRLFGKINLIDFIIILVFIALLAFVGLRIVSSQRAADSLKTIRISFFSEEVPNFVLDYTIPGSLVKDNTHQVVIGVLESFEIGAPLAYITDIDGVVRMVSREGYSSVSLSVLATAEIGPFGATIDGVLYSVGQTLVVFSGHARFWARVSGIEIIY